MAFGGLKGTLTGNGNNVGATNDLTGTVVTAPNDLIFVCFGQQTNLTATGVTDNLGNSYTAQNAGTDAGTSSGRAFWARSSGGTLSTVTVAASGSTNDYAGFVAVVEGPIQGIPVDANPANASDTTSPFNCPATGTLAQAQEIVMCWATTPQGTGATFAATSPNLLAGQTNNGTNIKAVIGYQAVAATTSVVPVFTAGANPADDTLGTISFKRDLTNPFVETADSSEELGAKTAQDFIAPNLLESTLTSRPFVSSAQQQPANIQIIPGQWLAPNLLETTLAPVASSSVIFRTPLIARQNKATKAEIFDPPNLLGTTLAPVVVSVPFFGQMQDLQRRLQKAITSDTPNLLAGTLSRPFIPNWNQQTSLKLQAVKQFDSPNLLGATLSLAFVPNWNQQAASKPAPAKTFDQPNLLLSTLGKPIFGIDWPLPVRRPQVARQDVATNLLPLTVAQIIRNAPQFDLAALKARTAAAFDPPNLLTSTLSRTFPFGQNDWVLSARAPASAEQDNVQSMLPLIGPKPPPVTAQPPWSGFMGNMGRMMTRRG